MKKILLLAFITSCSFAPKTPSNAPRDPNSKIFSCQFKEVLEGREVSFNFSPEHHNLLVQEATVELMESDFSAGGFIYKTVDGEKDWSINLEFISYDEAPAVKLHINKSPILKTPVFISKNCKL